MLGKAWFATVIVTLEAKSVIIMQAIFSVIGCVIGNVFAKYRNSTLTFHSDPAQRKLQS